jgi:hypothetical protein
MNLNEVLIKFSKGFAKSTYLEIGTQSTSRLNELKDHYSTLYGVDEDSENFTNVSRDLVKHKNIMLLCGKVFRVPANKYDVIVNNCGDIKEGTSACLVKNLSPTPFLMVFLNPLTEDFKKKYFDGMVVDLVDGASVVAISPDHRKKLLETFKKEGI